MNETTLRFTALDTLFFKEARPFEAIGGSELASIFPPPPRTVAGAIRTAIGDSLQADWEAFRTDANYTVAGVRLRNLIGCNDDMGRLAIKGIWLSSNNERLYPAPLYLLRKDVEFSRLLIGKAEQTRLGLVRLPSIHADDRGFKPLDKAWITRAGLEKVLLGGLPDHDDIRFATDLYFEEPRLGIARDNSLRTVEKGLLYQSRHIRPKKTAGLCIEAEISGLDGLSMPRRLVRLGAEGRLAGMEEMGEPSPFPSPPTVRDDTIGLILTLLSPARFKGNTWIPEGFEEKEMNRIKIWAGKLSGVQLTIRSMVIGKALREGGWDLAAQKPRPVQSLIPPGSAWYCTVDDGDLAGAIDTLHKQDQQIGEDKELGRGRIACGLWNRNKLDINEQGELP